MDADMVDAPSEMLSFRVRHQLSRSGPRLAELNIAGHVAVQTPSLVASTSRGVIPHISPDLVQRHTSIPVTYSGLEDFLEQSRKDPPILNTPEDSTDRGSSLRAYTGLPDTCLSILGPRRVPRLDVPHHNTNSELAISTSFGFASLEHEDYIRATRKLRPDISTTFADLVKSDRRSKKRIEKSADRTHAWLRDTIADAVDNTTNTPLFASIPPLEPEQQSFYLSDLEDEFRSHLSGICVYEPSTLANLPPNLDRLPALCLNNPESPHDILAAISHGVDLITTPFVTKTSEAGMSLTFHLKSSADMTNKPLAIDMWSPEHATSLSALQESCSCYTCTRHHRAYVHHLLQAKEMLAWTLLQIHNFHVVCQFFEQIRRSIENDTFEEDSKIFRMAYDSTMPQATGQGPRIRGYQIKSMGPSERKKNAKAYNKFDEQALKLEEAGSGIAIPDPADDAEALESQGLGQKLD